MFNRDKNWRRIHHLSHFKSKSINDYIRQKSIKLQYTKLREILKLIIQNEQDAIILKRDIKNAFRNVLVASDNQWLLKFHWKNHFYKETCLFFNLTIASFIFNLFKKNLNWILSFFLHWNVHHYLNDFVAIFSLKCSFIQQECQIYIEVIYALKISRNDFKDACETKIIVFEIEIDSELFIVRLLENKLKKAISLINKTLNEASIILENIQSLIDFLFFCTQIVRLKKNFFFECETLSSHFLWIPQNKWRKEY
jgi:hypothetical protein